MNQKPIAPVARPVSRKQHPSSPVSARGRYGWQSGATAIEYGLIAALVALSIYVGVLVAGNGLSEVFLVVGNQLQAVLDTI